MIRKWHHGAINVKIIELIYYIPWVIHSIINLIKRILNVQYTHHRVTLILRMSNNFLEKR